MLAQVAIDTISDETGRDVRGTSDVKPDPGSMACSRCCGEAEKMARPERFELPTLWFEGSSSENHPDGAETKPGEFAGMEP